MTQNEKRYCGEFQLLGIYSRDESEGVTKVQVPTNPSVNPRAATTKDRPTIDEQVEIEPTLFEWNRQHFSQAKDTPFMSGPLADLCGYDGLTPFAEQVLNQTADLTKFPEPQRDILSEMNERAKPMPFKDPTDEELEAGIKKWPEKTTTSPSGRHLGHYKALFGKVRDDTNVGNPQLFHLKSDQEPKQPTIATFALDMIRLIRRHQRPVSRWCKIWNVVIQKDPSDHRIHRHRTIHIGEADKQLVQKFDIAHKLMKHAEDNNALVDEAYGGRKDRQATDVAWLASMIINQAHHDHQPACIFFNDLQSCYDRVIESQANMSLRALGAPP